MPIRFNGLTLLALACCDSLESSHAGVCQPQTLAVLCEQDTCPSSPADAQRQLCDLPGLSFRVAHNDCGGDTVESGVGLIGSIYHFDATEQLVGGEPWGDVLPEPGSCAQGPYGQHCHATSELVTHTCSQDDLTVDAGAF
jgi:hypothetical protein